MTKTITVKVDAELIGKLRKKRVEWQNTPTATIVDITLRKLLHDINEL
jgi:hypothetical protein